MTQYLVIEIDNDETAKNLRIKLRAIEPRGVRILGVFIGPRDYCKCGRVDGRYHRQENVIGSKFGWLLHWGCKRPVAGLHQLKNQLTLSKVHWKENDEGYALVPSLTVFEVPVRNMVRDGD